MITVLRPLPRCSIRLLLQVLVVGILSSVGVLLEVTPSSSPTSSSLTSLSFTVGRVAFAQSVSDQEVQSYARSVLAIEPIRQAAYNKIKQMSGSSDVPVVACHRPSSLSDLPDTIRDIAVDYCNQAIAIVERNNLTITRFNQITVAHQANPDLSNRIQQVINQLQSNGQ
ncbi:MAG: DUF4168 domain-containing protein [Leptolyngbya sp. IPPAS B-1204]|uniref:DUF4168 domain-containing protein n=1 Tax=Leptolyngbya sp. NK1-12 TaxID=2547451 RepID=A0AA96WI89_9CYAN|nr:DUF4168 domain-containing protein [Leptolyngbya sp. NK1-12]MBF2046364.1 DUF4168 domain-containing protein [Elainella sp. C42_A2020_010]RNJ69717.1 MAG: DUF4168 domain-containing protein [Leptolyngbya sp. IPPAS B-1204]WNZ26018.1 DUF4168 domain-containing protein [Leptolyngbya sp. NK1-12]